MAEIMIEEHEALDLADFLGQHWRMFREFMTDEKDYTEDQLEALFKKLENANEN